MTFQQALKRFQAGDLSGALQTCQQLLARPPWDPNVLHLAGVIRGLQGKPVLAAELISRALQLHPNVPSWHRNLGLSLQRAGQTARAIEHYRRAVDLDPHFADAYRSLASALVESGNSAEALTQLEIAYELQPDRPDRMMHLGNVLEREGKLRQAEQLYRRAIAVQQGLGGPEPPVPGMVTDAGPYEMLADCLQRQGRIDDAIATYEQAAAERPADARILHLKSILALPIILESEVQIISARHRLMEGLDDFLTNPPILKGIERLGGGGAFHLAYHGLNDRVYQEKIVQLKRRLDPSLNYVAPHCESPAAMRSDRARIRIGFVSNFFYGHTIAKLNAGLIANLDRQQFEVEVFAFPRPRDEWQDRIRAAADRFEVIPARLPWARRAIAARELDILFFPDVGMENLSCHLALARLAPVQCVTWGHPVTTGSASIDYFISSVHLDGEQADHHYTERLVRLKHLAVSFYRPESAAARVSRRDFGRSSDTTAYVCPQTLFKLHPLMDDLFAGILRRDPKAELILIDGPDPSWRALLEKRLARRDVALASRVRFLSPMPLADYLDLLSQATVILDPRPFCGGNSSLEAFSQGTPIVTWPTDLLRGRITYALYRQMGISEAIVHNAEQYVEIAVKIGTQPEFRQMLHERILAQAPALFENNHGIRELELFLQQAVGKTT